MQETIDQSGKKEVWKNEDVLSRPKKIYSNKHRENKIKKLLKKIRKWYKTNFKSNTVPNPYKYFNKQRRNAESKKRKQKIAKLKESFKEIFKNDDSQNKTTQRRKTGNRRKKIQKELKNLALKPITNFTKKKKKDENIYIKYQRRILLKNIKDPITNLFKKKAIGVKSKKKKSFNYYFQKEQRKLRLQRYNQIKSNISYIPYRFVTGISKTFKKIFKIIFSFRKEYKLLKDDILRVYKNTDLRSRLIYTYLNSTLSFLLSFIIIFFINQLITVYICSIYNIPTLLHSLGGFINYSPRYRQVMDYLDIIYLIGPYSYLWTRFNIIIIFGAAPFISLLLAVIFYKLYGITKSKVRFLRLFFLWSMINSFNMFFGAYIVGAITRSGFIKCVEWIFFSRKYDIEEIIIMVLSSIVLITIGFFSRTFFLRISDHKELTISRNRSYFLIAQILLPYLTSIAFLILISFPYLVHYNLFIYLPIFLVVITAVVSPRGFQKENVTIVRNKRDYNILKYGAFLLFLIILVFKIFFYKGISVI